MMDAAQLQSLFMRDYAGSPAELKCLVEQSLARLRQSLGLTAAFVSREVEGEDRLLYIDQSADLSPRLAYGDAATEIRAASLECPIRRADGAIFGYLRCLSSEQTLSPSDTDTRLLRAIAELIASHISIVARLEAAGQAPPFTAADSAPFRNHVTPEAYEQGSELQAPLPAGDPAGRRARAISMHPFPVACAPDPLPLPDAIAKALATGRIQIEFQPIRTLEDLEIVGYEGLARFPDILADSVQTVFNCARACGLGPKLEMQAARRTIDATQGRAPADGFIALNLSYRTVLTDALQMLYERGCEGLPRAGYVIEISEAEAISNYRALREALGMIRAAGMKLAIDDVGAGQAGLQHILQLEPDMIKIDKSVTTELVDRKASRAMIAAITSFGAQTDCDIVVEGIETPAQLRILQDLGTPMGQGFLLGRPRALPPQGVPRSAASQTPEPLLKAAGA